MKKTRKMVLFITLAFGIAAIYFYFAITGISDRLGLRTDAGPLAETEVTFDMMKNRAFTSEDGTVVIGAASEQASAKTRVLSAAVSSKQGTVDYDPEQVWEHDEMALSNNFTLPDKVQLQDGSLGVLTIPKLNVSANIYETEDPIEAMSHGIAHFKSTSAWQGNVGVSAHNVNYDLTDGYFKKLHTLSKGDEIVLMSQLGERRYTVNTVTEVAENDWSYLGRTEDNRLTMITCITGKPSLRLCVQAIEKST